MSTRSFVNALIGLARDQKRQDRYGAKHGYPEYSISKENVKEDMLESGYFPATEVVKFTDALDQLLKKSDPRRGK